MTNTTQAGSAAPYGPHPASLHNTSAKPGQPDVGLLGPASRAES